MSTWLYCFLAYVYTAAATPDACSREILTYTRLILRESLQAGGDDWATYNRLFRALDNLKRLDWTTHPALHRLLGHRQTIYTVPLLFFSSCGRPAMVEKSAPTAETDHADHECALASVKDQGADRGPSPRHRRRGNHFNPSPRSAQRPWRIYVSI